MVYDDAFKAHTTDETKAVLSISSTNLIMVSPGCTSKCQTLDVCIKHWYMYMWNNNTQSAESEK